MLCFSVMFYWVLCSAVMLFYVFLCFYCYVPLLCYIVLCYSVLQFFCLLCYCCIRLCFTVMLYCSVLLLCSTVLLYVFYGCVPFFSPVFCGFVLLIRSTVFHSSILLLRGADMVWLPSTITMAAGYRRRSPTSLRPPRDVYTMWSIIITSMPGFSGHCCSSLFAYCFALYLDLSKWNYFGFNLELSTHAYQPLLRVNGLAPCVGVGAGARDLTCTACARGQTVVVESSWPLNVPYALVPRSRPVPSFLCFSFASRVIGRMWCLASVRLSLWSWSPFLSLSLSSGSCCHVDRAHQCPPCDRKCRVLRLSGRVPVGPSLSVAAAWSATWSTGPPSVSDCPVLWIRAQSPDLHTTGGLWPSAPPCQLCSSSCRRSLLRPSWVRTFMSLCVRCVVVI